jgi:hypothetical protein
MTTVPKLCSDDQIIFRWAKHRICWTLNSYRSFDGTSRINKWYCFAIHSRRCHTLNRSNILHSPIGIKRVSTEHIIRPMLHHRTQPIGPSRFSFPPFRSWDRFWNSRDHSALEPPNNWIETDSGTFWDNLNAPWSSSSCFWYSAFSNGRRHQSRPQEAQIQCSEFVQYGINTEKGRAKWHPLALLTRKVWMLENGRNVQRKEDKLEVKINLVTKRWFDNNWVMPSFLNRFNCSWNQTNHDKDVQHIRNLASSDSLKKSGNWIAPNVLTKPSQRLCSLNFFP